MRITLLARKPLKFDAAFGDGADRHVGLRAGSAVVRFAGGFLIAQDDSNFAAFLRGGSMTPVRLFAREDADTFSKARGNKAHKPDLECGTTLPLDGVPTAVFFGSGSTPARMRAALVRESGAGFSTSVVDLTGLYAAAVAALGLPADELNLEGACRAGRRVRFFQRGNGASGVNATFDVPLSALARALTGGSPVAREELTRVERYELGCVGAARLGFSAADELEDGHVLFAASAEASPNTYDDGPCAGSAIGLLDADGRLVDLAPLPVEPGQPPAKIEGLVVEHEDGPVVTALCITDPDDAEMAGEALWVKLELPL